MASCHQTNLIGEHPHGDFCPNLMTRAKKKKGVNFANTEAEDLPSHHDQMKQIFVELSVEDQQTEFLLCQSNPVRRLTPPQDRAVKQFYASLRLHNNQATTQLIWKDPQDRPRNNFIEAHDLFIRCEEFYRALEIWEAIQEIIDSWELMGFTL